MCHHTSILPRSFILYYILFGLGKSFRNIAPIDDIPNCRDVIWSNIFILQVITVFPDINTKQRDQTRCFLQRYLIRTSFYFEGTRSFVVPQPTPPRTLHTDRFRTELLFECIERSKIFFNLISQCTGGLTTAAVAGRCKICPKCLCW